MGLDTPSNIGDQLKPIPIPQPIPLAIRLSTPIPKLRTSRQVLMSCMIGNALEWYDFVIYGYFVVIFGQLFFPHANHLTQILASWGIF